MNRDDGTNLTLRQCALREKPTAKIATLCRGLAIAQTQLPRQAITDKAK
jgi:hypothetical protein